MNKQQLAAKIWASANAMRSKIDASEYKDYILGFIFYKYLSEREESYLKANGFDAQSMLLVSEDSPETIDYVRRNLGYCIYYTHLYSYWINSPQEFDVAVVREALSAFGRNINKSHRRVFEGIFETLETGLSKLGDTAGAQTKAINSLLQLIKDIPMDGKQGYDVLGYIYEYLISNFAANAGKKAGEFYTPHEVSLLMAEIVASHLEGRYELKIYDPTSGSGSLLINIGQAIAKHMGSKGSIKYYAQELKESTYNLTRMNLVMRGILPDNIVTRNGDTLEHDWPWFEDGKPETYDPLFVDAVVSNPPYSQNWDPSNAEVDPRFSGFGVAPKSKADYAFLLHDLYHLKPDGIMCIVLPHGVLFRGGEEGQIRRNLIENDHISAVIGLPANIFFGTGIPTVIMVLRKQRTESDVLFIDASKGFVKEGKNNKLRASDIKRIVDAYESRASIEKFSRLVSKDEIRANDYNLNIPRYVDSSEQAEGWDIYATMFGGIPRAEVDALEPYWQALPGLREELFADDGGPTLALRNSQVKDVLARSQAAQAYREHFKAAFADFETYLYEELLDDPMVIHLQTEEVELSRDLFDRLKGIPLIDRYAAYELLDESWQTISADLEILQTEGMDAAKQVDPRMVLKKKGGKDVEEQDGWMGHVLPFELVQDMLLTEEKQALAEKEERIRQIDSEITEILEGLTEDEKESPAVSEDGSKFVTGAKEFKAGIAQADEELAEKLKHVQQILTEQKGLKSAVKKDAAALELHTKAVMDNLSQSVVNELLRKKWITPLAEKVQGLATAVLDDLANRVQALEKKYETTFASIDTQIEEAERELSAMLGNLVGNEHDLAGIAEFIRLLGGE